MVHYVYIANPPGIQLRDVFPLTTVRLATETWFKPYMICSTTSTANSCLLAASLPAALRFTCPTQISATSTPLSTALPSTTGSELHGRFTHFIIYLSAAWTTLLNSPRSIPVQVLPPSALLKTNKLYIRSATAINFLLNFLQ